MVSEWTRDDLPDHVAIRDVDYMHGDGTRSRVIDLTLDMVVGHLNANHPKSDADRWRRAHEIVEQERDQARESLRRLRDETDFDLFTVRDQLKQCRGEREQMTRERDEWRARAEAAEARTAPDIPSHQPDGTRMDASHLPIGTDDGPAVHVVRESDVAAVEVTRDSGGWCADGAWVAGVDDTAEWVRGRAAEMVVYAARNEAVARAIEQDAATDPIADAIRDGLNVWGTTDEGVRQIAESIRRAISNDGGENVL